MRVIVCGGRDYDDEDRVRDFIRHNLPTDGTVTIVTGGARGADRLAEDVARNFGYGLEVYPAQWEKHGRAAGPIRNLHMLSLGADLVVAFPGGRGTAHMVKVARDAGVAVVEVGQMSNWDPVTN